MNHDTRLDDHPDVHPDYIVAWDSVMFHACPTCGQPAEQRCNSRTGRELSITHTHMPRRRQADAASYAVRVAPGYFDDMPELSDDETAEDIERILDPDAYYDSRVDKA